MVHTSKEKHSFDVLGVENCFVFITFVVSTILTPASLLH
jgi:hypothetical protein